MFCSDPPPVTSGIEYWRYESLAANQKIRGWKAGHLVGKLSHHLNGTKPCVGLFTKGALPCGFDHGLCPVSWHAWMPLIDETGERIVVGIRRRQYPFAAAIPIGDPIEVKRGHRITLPVIATRLDWCHGRKNGSIDPQNPAVIKLWLLRLWKLPALTAWVMSHPEAELDQAAASDSRDLAKLPTAPERPPSEEEKAKAVAVLRAGLHRFEEPVKRNGHAKHGSVHSDVDVQKVITVADLPDHHPVKLNLKKRGVK